MPVSGLNPAETITTNALDAAVEQGYADPERAGVIGHSLGGYSTCCVITRTERFRAAVAIAPFTNLLTFGLSIKANTLMGLRWVEGGFVRMGGTFWENSQRYIDNSPVFRLNQVSTPLLLLHGTADELPITQSEEMYAGLLRLGKIAMLARYHGEGYSPEMWSVENYQDYWRQIVNWFGRYVRNS